MFSKVKLRVRRMYYDNACMHPRTALPRLRDDSRKHSTAEPLAGRFQSDRLHSSQQVLVRVRLHQQAEIYVWAGLQLRVP